jgi:WhiB family redox-sensing transcriptional regulator
MQGRMHRKVGSLADIERLPEPIVDHWDWQGAAACRGMDSEVFFHPSAERARGRRARIQAAKAVCGTCPVIAQCLAHALAVREPYGVWGGRSEDERAKLLGLQSLRYPARIRTAVASAKEPAPAG